MISNLQKSGFTYESYLSQVKPLFYFSHTNTQNRINKNAAPPKIKPTVSDAFSESQIIPLRSSFVIGGF